MGLKPLYLGCAPDCDLKILSVLQKSKQLVFKKIYRVPVMILLAYISLSRLILKGVFIRRNIASDLTQHLVASNFATNRENVKGELCLKVIIPFSIIVCCLVIE